MKNIEIKRIYEPSENTDSYRILINRLWPRGITKAEAHLDEWDKEIAPTHELRKWFAHKETNFEKFTKLYLKELEEKETDLDRLRKIAETKSLLLLYGAKNEKINHAVILKKLLSKKS